MEDLSVWVKENQAWWERRTNYKVSNKVMAEKKERKLVKIENGIVIIEWIESRWNERDNLWQNEKEK